MKGLPATGEIDLGGARQFDLRGILNSYINMEAYEQGCRYTGEAPIPSVFGHRQKLRKLVVLPPSALLVTAEIYDRLEWTSWVRAIARDWQEWTRVAWFELFAFFFESSPIYTTYFDLLTLLIIPFVAALFVENVAEPKNSISWHLGNAKKLPPLLKFSSIFFSLSCVVALMAVFAWPHFAEKLVTAEGRFYVATRFTTLIIFVVALSSIYSVAWLVGMMRAEKWKTAMKGGLIATPFVLLYYLWIIVFDPSLAEMQGDKFSYASMLISRLSLFVIIWCAARNWVIFRDILYLGVILIFSGEVLDLVIPYSAT